MLRRTGVVLPLLLLSMTAGAQSASDHPSQAEQLADYMQTSHWLGRRVGITTQGKRTTSVTLKFTMLRPLTPKVRPVIATIRDTDPDFPLYLKVNSSEVSFTPVHILKPVGSSKQEQFRYLRPQLHRSSRSLRGSACSYPNHPSIVNRNV